MLKIPTQMEVKFRERSLPTEEELMESPDRVMSKRAYLEWEVWVALAYCVALSFSL